VGFGKWVGSCAACERVTVLEGQGLAQSLGIFMWKEMS
jgi:hypothetical protein